MACKPCGCHQVTGGSVIDIKCNWKSKSQADIGFSFFQTVTVAQLLYMEDYKMELISVTWRALKPKSALITIILTVD